MLSESTSLAAVAFLLADTLREEYEIDPAPLLAKSSIDPDFAYRPGARIPSASMEELWVNAMQLTGDSTMGIRIGSRATVSTYYVLGHAWLASSNLVDGMERLIRFDHVMDTLNTNSAIVKEGREYRLSEGYSSPELKPDLYMMDAAIAGILKLCESALGKPVYPSRVEYMDADSPHLAAHQDLFRAPIEFGKNEYALYFDAEEMEAPLRTSIPDVADAADRIAERYLDSLNKDKVSAQVRSLLVRLLPAGGTDQESIASQLHRSSSTLQRQLSDEGTTYRGLLESTRRKLAEEYLANSEHTHAQIAFLLGFSDQSNFSRAFKRWTGKSPGQFRSEAN